MKFLPVLLAATLMADAAPADPGAAALQFLEKVRQHQLDLKPGGDTAMSPHTAESKRRLIGKQLDQLARDLGSDPLELGEVRTDENFAGVLVRKIGGFDPARLQVFAVALVKKGGEWSAAPVPASFENSGAGYATALRQRLDTLETWMLRQQVVELEEMRARSADRLRRKIETSLSAETLRGYRAADVGREFLAACQRRDLHAVLGFLGGLSSEPPNDWGARLKMAERAISAGDRAKGSWRMLVSPEVATAMVFYEQAGEEGVVKYACLDPLAKAGGSGPLREHFFGLAKSPDGLWRVDPPEGFLTESGDDGEAEEESTDQEMAGRFAEAWVKVSPLSPQPTAAQAHQEMIRGLHAGRIKDLLAVSQLDLGAGVARKALFQAAGVWAALHDPGSVRRAIPLEFIEDGGAAVGLFQFFSSREPGKFDLRSFGFEKGADGWQWSARPVSALSATLESRVAEGAKRWSGGWQQHLLGGVPQAGDFTRFPPPSEVDARACVEKWLLAAGQGDVEGAIQLFAKLGSPASAEKAFQNFGYEANGAKLWQEPPVITGVARGAFWTAVAVTIRQQGGKSVHPVFTVAGTAAGPRLLAEVDLFTDDNRSRNFLNNEALARLRKLTADAAADELKSLLEGFRAAAGK